MSETVCPTENHNKVIVLPTIAVKRELLFNGTLQNLFLSGFKNNWKSGRGDSCNFLLSNGFKYEGQDFEVMHTHMLPQDAHKTTKNVRIYQEDHIHAFKFFDKNDKVIF
jgi:hypothetical protein